jgi:hypothetical protein
LIGTRETDTGRKDLSLEECKKAVAGKLKPKAKPKKKKKVIKKWTPSY